MAHKCNLSIISVILSLLLVICHVCHVTSQTESKPNVQHYCGQQFIEVFNLCCGNNPRCAKKKRQLEDFDVLASRDLANAFFRGSAKRRQYAMVSKRSSTNAVEECCVEGCSLSEVAEYNCI